MQSMKYDLLDKSEILIKGITLNNANLSDIAFAVSKALGLEEKEVLVIDVRGDILALDVLRPDVDPRIYAGRKNELLASLAALPGITLSGDTDVCSRGMLGWISVSDRQSALDQISAARRSTQQYHAAVRKRAIVFPSGTELELGQIEDTNTPLIKSKLEEAGYTVSCGDILKDDEELFAGKLRNAIDEGYGILITTGGVGAEDKDHSVEATLHLDPDAAVPYIVMFDGHSERHKKAGIRIGVGKVGEIWIINLPGPNDEVAACIDTLIMGLKDNQDKYVLAENLANILRSRLREKMKCHHQKLC